MYIVHEAKWIFIDSGTNDISDIYYMSGQDLKCGEALTLDTIDI